MDKLLESAPISHPEVPLLFSTISRTNFCVRGTVDLEDCLRLKLESFNSALRYFPVVFRFIRPHQIEEVFEFAFFRAIKLVLDSGVIVGEYPEDFCLGGV